MDGCNCWLHNIFSPHGLGKLRGLGDVVLDITIVAPSFSGPSDHGDGWLRLGAWEGEGYAFWKVSSFPIPKRYHMCQMVTGVSSVYHQWALRSGTKWTCRRPNPTLARHVLLYYGVLAEAGVNEELANWKQSWRHKTQMEGALQQTIFLLAFWIFLIRIEFLNWKVTMGVGEECGNRSIGHRYLPNVHLENNTLQLNFNPWGPNVPKRDSLFQMIGSCSKNKQVFLGNFFLPI